MLTTRSKDAVAVEENRKGFLASMYLPFYITVSAATSIVEKYALRYIPDPFLLAIVEIIFSLVILMPAIVRIDLSKMRLVRWIPTAFFFACALLCTKSALGLVNLGTISVLKMGRPVVTVATEALFFQVARVRLTAQTVPALFVLFSGTVLFAVSRGFHGELIGVILMGVAVAASTIDRLWCRYLLAEKPSGETSLSIMVVYYVVTLIAAVLAETVQSKDPMHSINLFRNLPPLGIVAWVFAAFLNSPAAYARVLAQRVTSTTSFLVCNSLAKILILSFGIIVLQERYNRISSLGMSAVIFGAAWYMLDRHWLALKIEEEDARVEGGTVKKFKQYEEYDDTTGLLCEDELDGPAYESEDLLPEDIVGFAIPVNREDYLL
ncbi:hypothetical protein AAMO2058_000046300 [Amorphochlora amoebiformis]